MFIAIARRTLIAIVPSNVIFELSKFLWKASGLCNNFLVPSWTSTRQCERYSMVSCLEKLKRRKWMMLASWLGSISFFPVSSIKDNFENIVGWNTRAWHVQFCLLRKRFGGSGWSVGSCRHTHSADKGGKAARLNLSLCIVSRPADRTRFLRKMKDNSCGTLEFSFFAAHYHVNHFWFAREGERWPWYHFSKSCARWHTVHCSTMLMQWKLSF